MSDTAAAVESVVSEAFALPTEPVAAEPIRREDVRERILNSEWKDDAALQAERANDSEAGAILATPGAEGASDTATPDEATSTPAEGDEPPPEAVIGEGGARIVVRSADGKFAAAPDVKLEFSVGDKTYLKSPAELVRMARDGVAGQYFAQEAKQLREQHVPALQQQLAALQQELEAQSALNMELLNDEAAYYTRREQWAALNSPEAKLARYEQQRMQELEESRATQQMAQQQQLVQTYFVQEIKPVQDEILNGYPQVTLEAKMGRISMDTMPLLRNGVIPPERLPEYRAYLDGPFREWIQAEAARIDQVNAQREAQLNQLARQGQQRAQQVVQAVGKQLAPNGRPAPDAAPPPRKPRNREEAKAMIIGRPWQG